MLFGLKVSAITPKLAAGGKDRTVVSMFLYGVSYAIASLGCTIGLFLPALASAERNGYVSAVLATVLYGIGMGVTLTALTVALAMARTGLLRFLRRAMQHLDLVAGALMVLTGLYLIWYWGSTIGDPVGDKGAAVEQVESWQSRLQNWLNDLGALPIALLFGGITLAAVAVAFVRRGRPPRTTG